jgi:hypothetical protein
MHCNAASRTIVASQSSSSVCRQGACRRENALKGASFLLNAWSVKSVGHLGFRKLAEGVVQGYLSDAKSAVSIDFSHRALGFVVQALYDAA